MFRVSQLLRHQCHQTVLSSLVRTPQARSVYKQAVSKPGRGKSRPAPQRQQRPHREDAGQSNVQKLRVAPKDIPDFYARNVRSWLSTTNNKLWDRLERFGVPRSACRPLIKAFVTHMEAGKIFPLLNCDQIHLARLSENLATDAAESMDQEYTRILYEWISLPEGQAAVEGTVPADVVGRMQALFRVADLSMLSWEYTATRRSRPRKFIMHVGPTNSGKTHNALRALAAARRGLYAGPLRLLAYEIFTRLNSGQIVPLGVDPDADAEPDAQSVVEVTADGQGGSVAVTKKGNSRFARACNMVTGEEHKIVDEDATLLSCTVEMVPFTNIWDVAVVDEIQLIADKQRGGAWMNAILGLNAAEIHLCGEESAIPLVEKIVQELGDHLEINRYQRLTPLVVAEHSLQGDLKRIEKGDCVVTFSRTGLFAVKGDIEKKAKMRCALAYGRLPPEIRAEQAALFNDPNSDYNVLVGSDAVGMGLNLYDLFLISLGRPLSCFQEDQAGRFRYCTQVRRTQPDTTE